MTCSIGHISCVIVSFVRHMYITVVKFSPSPCARAAGADDDDEIILGIIVGGCKGRMMIDIFDHTHWKSPRQKFKFSLLIDIFPIYFEFLTP